MIYNLFQSLSFPLSQGSRRNRLLSQAAIGVIAVHFHRRRVPAPMEWELKTGHHVGCVLIVRLNRFVDGRAAGQIPVLGSERRLGCLTFPVSGVWYFQ